MLINGKNISSFKAKLMNRNITNSKFEIVNEWMSNSLNPFIKDNFNYKYKTLTFTLDIICSNANELEIMKSSLIKELAISTIKFDDIDYYYRGFVSGDPSTAYIMKGNETLDITMSVIAEKIEVIETINRITSKTINVTGNIETPAIVEITPSVELDIVLTGLDEDSITLEKLTAGKKVILNGEDCTVTELGVNKFGDTTMWNFPRLKPGVNAITVSRNDVDITIRYKPRFI